LVETQKLDRAGLAALRSQPPGATPRPGERPATAGPLVDELAPGSDADRARTVRDRARRAPLVPPRAPRRRWWPWLAVVAIAALGGATASVLVKRGARYRSTVQITGVALTRGTTIGKLVVETDGAVEPAELARLYTSTLDALRLFAKTAPGGN